MTPTPKKRYLKGILEVTIHRGYDINSKECILKTKCVDCGRLLADFTRTGKPRQNPRCLDSPDKTLHAECINKRVIAATNSDKNHMERLTYEH